jgi:hypothetical protein
LISQQLSHSKFGARPATLPIEMLRLLLRGISDWDGTHEELCCYCIPIACRTNGKTDVTPLQETESTSAAKALAKEKGRNAPAPIDL